MTRLSKFLRARLGDDVEIRSQNPIQLADGALPAPDIAVVTLHPSDLKAYEPRHPVPAESLLVVEVADTTLGFDLGEKARMYALHEVQDYWVVDLTGHRVIVHRNPTAAGYASVRVVESGGELNLVSFPGVAFTADEILG